MCNIVKKGVMDVRIIGLIFLLLVTSVSAQDLISQGFTHEDGIWSMPSVGQASIEIPYLLLNYELSLRMQIHGFGNYGALTVFLREESPYEAYILRFHDYGLTVTERYGYWNDLQNLLTSRESPPKGRWADLRVLAQGELITVWVDDKLVAEFPAKSRSGGIRIRAENARISLEQVQLVAPELIPAPARSRELPLNGPIPPTGQITGTFLSLDSTNHNRPRSYWQEEFGFMVEMGMDTLLVRNLLDPTGNPYPVVDIIMEEAAKYGISVFLGIPGDGGYQWTSTSQNAITQQITKDKAGMTTLAQRYGSHPSLKGWYLQNEVDEKDLIEPRLSITTLYYKELTQRAHDLTDLPVLVSPSFESTTSPNWLERKWREILEVTGIDILAPQDSVGAKRSEPEFNSLYYEAFRRATDAVGATLWANCEIFDIQTWRPAPIELVHRQLVAGAHVVEKTIIFEFHRYMNPTRSIWTRSLYDGYAHLIQ